MELRPGVLIAWWQFKKKEIAYKEFFCHSIISRDHVVSKKAFSDKVLNNAMKNFNAMRN